MTYTRALLYSSIVTTLLLAAVLGYGFYDIRAKNQETSVLLNEADIAAQSDTLDQSIRTVKNNSTEEIALLDESALSEEKLVPFIELVEGVGKSLGLKTNIVSVTSDKPDPRASAIEPIKVHLEIETDGTWSSSVGFLHALENLPTKVSVDSTTLVLSITPPEADTKTADTKTTSSKRWKTSSRLTIYSFK